MTTVALRSKKSWMVALLVAATILLSPGVAAVEAQDAGGDAVAPGDLPQQLIVAFDAGEGSGPAAAALSALAAGFGVGLDRLRTLATGADVLKVTGRRLSDEVLGLLADRLSRLPGVGYAEVDLVMHTAFVPNDPRFGDQWAYSDPTAGIRAPAAWDVSTGANVVVGQIDTGYRPHADLAANIVGGYDFVSEAARGGDGNGRDADALDPGDTCNFSASTWHGTHVAGSIAAVSNNGTGVAGVAFNAKILPLRALGRCGGTVSDIADAIVWGSGGAVAGLPTNPNPARVLNLSLGGSGSCPVTYQTAIDSARSRGTVVLAAAGNQGTASTDFTPGNCAGVVSVTATGRNGGRPSYANIGSLVDVAAPGGDSSSGILSTFNAGSMSPGADSYASVSGTSMAVAHASGVAALILSQTPSLTPDQVEARLKATARAFPAPCSGCGAGLIDAAAAVGGTGPGPTTTSSTMPGPTTTVTQTTVTTPTTVVPVTTTRPPTTTTIAPPTTVTPAVPSAPRNLFSTRPPTGPGVRLYWTAPSKGPVTGFNIYRRTGSGALAKLADVGLATTYTDTSTVAGVSYTYAVSAENGPREGPLSGTTTMTAR